MRLFRRHFAIAGATSALLLGSICLVQAQAEQGQVKAQTGGVAVGGNVSGSSINIGVSPEQLQAIIRQSTDLSEAQKKIIEGLERELALNRSQVQAALEIVGEANIPPERLGAKLIEIAQHFKTLQKIAEVQSGDDAKITGLKEAARKAIVEGELVKADALLADVDAEQGKVSDKLQANRAETSAQRGQIALTRLRYAEAAEHFAKAFSLLPSDSAHEAKRIEYLEGEAFAFYRQGNEFGDNAALVSASDRYKALLLLRSRERVPLQWATTQMNLGTVLETRGERESGTGKLEEAVAAYREALKEFTRERVPLQWATTQMNLGNALGSLGGTEIGTGKLEEAVAAYREALKEFMRERVPLDWAKTQMSLGNALNFLGEREIGTGKLEEAVAAFREALKERTRERVPLKWARTQNNLGYALWRLGERESGTGKLEEAVAAYRETLKEFTRERVPLDWATTQMNLGNALTSLGGRESGTRKLEEAVAAYREALKEYTPQTYPRNYQGTIDNLNRVLTLLKKERKKKAAVH